MANKQNSWHPGQWTTTNTKPTSV